MAKLEVLTWPHPVLKKKSAEVSEIGEDMKIFAREMIETMYASNGVGLAAPQVGHNIRLMVIDIRPLDEDGHVIESEMTELERAVAYPLVLFNPKILERKEKTVFEEGCLSVPGFTEEVQRSKCVVVSALDLNGHEISFECDGLLAICIQHEIDHLDGKLFIDRLSPVKSEIIKSKIKKFGYPAPEEPVCDATV